MNTANLQRLAAFAEQPGGGNPAGVWIGDALPEPAEMQAIAAAVGYSETAFVAPLSGLQRTVRYYSPQAEVSFCGHATIATGVVLGRQNGDATYTLATAVGDVPVTARHEPGGVIASLTSVPTRHEQPTPALLHGVLDALNWSFSVLDPHLPPANAYAGAWHLILAVSDPSTLATLDYDFDALKSLMIEHGLTTLQLVHRESDVLFHARNPFPVGGVVEDPATGASAAALGGYLRDAGLIGAPCTFAVRQGEAMGRPSRLTVDVPAEGGVVVTGTAIDI